MSLGSAPSLGAPAFAETVDIRKPGNDMGGAWALTVNPSPYFDVAVEKVAAPMAVRSGVIATQAGAAKARSDLMRSATARLGQT